MEEYTFNQINRNHETTIYPREHWDIKRERDIRFW